MVAVNCRILQIIRCVQNYMCATCYLISVPKNSETMAVDPFSVIAFF